MVVGDFPFTTGLDMAIQGVITMAAATNMALDFTINTKDAPIVIMDAVDVNSLNGMVQEWQKTQLILLTPS